MRAQQCVLCCSSLPRLVLKSAAHHQAAVAAVLGKLSTEDGHLTAHLLRAHTGEGEGTGRQDCAQPSGARAAPASAGRGTAWTAWTAAGAQLPAQAHVKSCACRPPPLVRGAQAKGEKQGERKVAKACTEGVGVSQRSAACTRVQGRCDMHCGQAALTPKVWHVVLFNRRHPAEAGEAGGRRAWSWWAPPSKGGRGEADSECRAMQTDSRLRPGRHSHRDCQVGQHRESNVPHHKRAARQGRRS